MEPQTSGLIPTLVISLVAAFAGGLAVRTIKLPSMLGYLLAGILIGPTMAGAAANQAMASDLAEIGVALLLFNVGLHFSLKDLLAVRRIAVAGAFLQMMISGTLGFFAAWSFFGCSVGASIIMGLSFSVSSTAISARLLEEHRQFATLAGRIAIGWLVVQDIAAILAMVIFPAFLTTKADTSGTLLSSLGLTLLQVLSFAAVMLFIARRYIPKLLEYVARIGSRELFTLAVIVIALGIAYGSAIIFGVSIALGAFFAGMVIGESDLNHHAAAEALSLQQIFTIFFFVSVGMLFDPASLIEMPLDILMAWGVIVLGMGFVTCIILVGMRVPPQAAALVGGVFAQAGELSFILSQLAFKWGILTQKDRDLILATALISIALNPLVARGFVRLGKWAGTTKTLQRWQKYGEISLPELVHPLKGHIILVGHGRVGQRVAQALKKNGLPFVVIESDRRLMEKLRRTGTPVIYGDAAREMVLSAARPEHAKLMILTMPQAGHVRNAAALAKRLNPTIEVIVRVHEESEVKQMARLGVGLSILGEREIAIGLSAYALQNYGVDSKVILETLNALRQPEVPAAKKEKVG